MANVSHILHFILLAFILKLSYSISKDSFINFTEEDLNTYIITSDVINETFLPEVGNGHIATQIKNKYIFMNGIYNGFGINSHRAAIPTTVNWNISTSDRILKYIYSLDSVLGVFYEIWIYKEYNLSLSTYISRVDRQILIRNISLSASKNHQSIVLTTQGTQFDRNSPDFDFTVSELSNALFIKGSTKIPENNHSSELSIFILLEKIPPKIILNKTISSWAFVTSMDSVESNSFVAFNKALSEKSQLLNRHCQGWIETWDNGLITVGSPDPQLSISVHVAQYYLLSSLPNKNWADNDPTWFFYGLSPTGLAHGYTLDDYLGHVFWDMDTWMFPAILPFHTSLAIEMVNYRKKMLNSAKENSRKTGLKGARYPWESARTGFETTFDPIVGKNEIHISSDVSFAIQQLLWINSKHNKDLYYDIGKDIINNIARFWESRLIYNEKWEKYEILNVMPPDEYVNSCNNSAFTNLGAVKSLEAPYLLAKRYNDNITKEILHWYNISKNIGYPYDKKMNLILEYDGYKLGSMVKQADVVLLQYPLQLQKTESCFINNLNYYENVTDVNGPAMTWSIFSINWFSLNETEKGEHYFIKNLNYITSPFYVWSEIINGGGAKNFHTGIGGYLQNILYGYMGMRLEFVNDGQLIFDPKMTTLIQNIKLHNITFQNSNIDFSVTEGILFIKLLNNESIFILAVKSQRRYLLNYTNNGIKIPSQMVIVTSAV